ncbi:hypothetical protein EV356DRAFT_531532 [Viridothelium virens]|uniref:Cytochrome P450 n=1 Tax=Viridothelium virens TaxID=1048519 RepID=A0A6A6HDT3_VIRVR|nr:hypothetical protein EV356DRAFT_531532 [Viridothelium virens]
MDPVLHPDPLDFDGYRFAELQHYENVSAARTSYTARNKESMAFGHSRHTCPGRILTAAEIKMFMAYLLINYDFHFTENQRSKGRPQSLPFETQYLPDQKTVVMMKKRTPKTVRFENSVLQGGKAG